MRASRTAVRSSGAGSGDFTAAGIGRARRLLQRSLCAVVLALFAHATASRAEDDGFHAKPHLGFTSGDHHVDLRLQFRYRWENWNAFVDDWEDFHGLRTRFALDYRFRDRVRFFAQGQQTAVLGLASDANGAGALYRANSGNDKNPSSVRPSQIFADLGLTDDLTVRLGRSFVKLGTLVPYEEANWQFLKTQRLSQRLLGTVGWTNGERAYDGGTAQAEFAGHYFHAFALQPTTGVFVVDDDAYEENKELAVAGLDWTAARGVFGKDTEIGAFFIAYADDRDPDRVAGLFGDIEVYTLGASWLGVYPLGPGRVDTILWGAFQFGDYEDVGPTTGSKMRDQIAGALIAEAGYQLHRVWSAPWLRFGVNFASGDDDPDDGDRHTFFNILPTNHLYYGALDQFAFQNLIDMLLQFRFSPHPRLGLDLTYHHFWLHEDDDFRWAGTGAFSKRNLGYVRNPSNGSQNAGDELDLTVAVKVHEALNLSFGYSYLWGGKVFDGLADNDASFAYTQLAVAY
jgi:hypothetical protein